MDEPVDQQCGHIVRISAEQLSNSTGDGNNQHVQRTILRSVEVINQLHKTIGSDNEGQQSLKSLIAVKFDFADVSADYGSHSVCGDEDEDDMALSLLFDYQFHVVGELEGEDEEEGGEPEVGLP